MFHSLSWWRSPTSFSVFLLLFLHVILAIFIRNSQPYISAYPKWSPYNNKIKRILMEKLFKCDNILYTFFLQLLLFGWFMLCVLTSSNHFKRLKFSKSQTRYVTLFNGGSFTTELSISHAHHFYVIPFDIDVDWRSCVCPWIPYQNMATREPPPPPPSPSSSSSAKCHNKRMYTQSAKSRPFKWIRCVFMNIFDGFWK